MKLLAKIFGVLILVVVIVLAVGLVNIDRIVEESVARFGPEITGTSVTLEESSIKPWSGKGSLRGLAIGNPEDFGAENAFSLGEIAVEVDLSTLKDEVVVINRVAIISPEVLYLHDGSTDNLRALMANITERLGSSDETESVQSESDIKIIIDEFVFSGANISASHALLGDRRLQISLPDLLLTDIGRDSGGATLQQAGEQIFSYLNAEIRGQVTGSAIYTQALGEVQELVTAEIERVQEEAREQLDNIQSQADEVEQQVRGLLDAFNR